MRRLPGRGATAMPPAMSTLSGLLDTAQTPSLLTTDSSAR
jgi:hypothetical protein